MIPRVISGNPTATRGVDDAVVAAQGEFEPPAERRAMQHSDHRLQEVFDRR